MLTILTYLVLKNEQQVGNFNGLMGLLGVAISLGPRHRTGCAVVGGAMLVLSTLLLPLYLTAWALIGFGLLRAIGGPLHGNALAPMALQVSIGIPRRRRCARTTSCTRNCALASGEC